MKYLFHLSYLSLILLMSACTKKEAVVIGGTDPAMKIAPDGFKFSTFKSVDIKIRLLNNENKPLSSVLVDVFDPQDLLQPILKSLTTAEGFLNAKLNLSSFADTLIVQPHYIGLLDNATAVISNNSISGVIGGTAELTGNFVTSTGSTSILTAKNVSAGATTFSYMGSFDELGRPVSYLEPTGDKVTTELLSYLNYSLPEQQDVRKLHPGYLTSAAIPDLKITENSDIWITFLSEGAGNLNSIGYYTYPTGNPPAKATDISNITYIFPNSSLLNSGGNLRSGDKVKLGNFDKGISIGFVLFASGWGNNGKVNEKATKFFSDPALNPETDESLKRHTVLLNYAAQDLYLIGFEDILRTTSGCDHDFNDVAFYATSNPTTGISQDGVQKLAQPKDSDGDGISDQFDQFPNDAAKAYTTYYPSATSFGTISFEDNWPSKGDYDMNDLVVNYRYTFVLNSKNMVVEMTADYVPIASGASFKNGFGVQFPFSSTSINSVTGQKFIGNYIKLDANGTEAGQSKAVVIAFDNHEAFLKSPDGSFFINTINTKDKVKADTARLNIKFAEPMLQATLGAAPFNPFLISNQRRGYEIHLPGYAPTNKADLSLFGTMDDASIPAAGIYYVSKQNWPWSLDFGSTFNYPAEQNAISKTYLHFGDWAVSGGGLFTDWFSNTTTGYRNDEQLYKK